MRLTNLNCPQCNGNLSQQGESFFCTSCGSAFTIDYDENDVRYTDLVTQADRTRQLIARDVELMQMRHKLREEMAQRKQNRDWAREKKNDIRRIGSIIATYYVSMFLFFGVMIGLFIYFGYTIKSANKEEKVKSKEVLSAMSEVLQKDRSTIENAALEGQQYLLKERNSSYQDSTYAQDRWAKLKDTPTPYAAYLMVDTSAKSKLYIFFESVFVYEDTNEEFPVYDCVAISKFSWNEKQKKIDTDYVCSIGNRTSGTFGGYMDADQLYLECVEGEYSGTSLKIDQVFEEQKGGKNG